MADKGSAVSITVSTGDGLAPIPDVTGLPQDEANRRLTEAGYTTRVRQENSPTVPAGNVIRTDPAAGTTPKPGATTVTVFVSLGATTTTLGKVVVPNVVGQTESNARATLEAKGFAVQSVSATGGTAGRVKAQSPSGGTTATQGSTVVITVSTGTTSSTSGTSSTTSTTTPPGSTTTTRLL
jgi:serine/threonine-protein kinase